MPIGIVRSVDTAKGTISVDIQDPAGSRAAPRVRLMKDRGIPEIGTRVIILKDGRNYYYFGTPEEITPEAEENRSSEDRVAGDEWMGDPDGANVTVRKGGMIQAMADKVTGFIANKATGIIQMLGKIIAMDTTYYHKLVKTEGSNTKIDLRLSGSPNSIPVPIEMIKQLISTKDGTISLDLSAFTEIDAKVNINPVSGNLQGADINIEAQTPFGITKIQFDGATGNITASAPNGLIRVQDARSIWVNSNGDPRDRVVRAGDRCWNTGGYIGQGSDKLLVGDGLL